MPIEVIDKIKQKNGGTFKLMDAKDIAIDDKDIESYVKEMNKKISMGSNNSVIRGAYVSDSTVGNGVPDSEVFPLEYLRSLQDVLYATFMRNLRKNVSQLICCQGDSLTYGHDVKSEDRRPSAGDIAPDGSTSNTTRAKITYPEALEKCLKKIYPNVKVINRGRSGSYTKQGYELWIKPSGANLTIMMYGTNDSRASWVDYKGDIKEYLKWYEKLIARELLRGSAIIILTPPKETENDLDVDTFSQALFLLGEKYGIPVIKTDEFMYNYGTEIYSDEVHFNGIGYEIFGTRVSSLLIGEGCVTPQLVLDGSKINPLPTIYNYSKNGDAYVSKNQNIYPTAQGFHIGINDGTISFSFYSQVDDLLVFPSLYIRGNVTFKIELDFGVKQGMYTNSQIIDKGKNNVIKVANSTIEETVNKTYPYYNRYKTPDKFIHIVNKGWHTVTITTKGDVDNNVIFYGLEFINYNTNKALTIKPLDIKKISNLQNNFSITDGEYYKTLQGEIALQGELANISKQLVFILDEGYRPTKSKFFITSAKKTEDSNFTTAVISVHPSGGVYVESSEPLSNIWLDGVRFKTI